jgi:hypothetical protein
MNTDWTFSQNSLLSKGALDVKVGICLSLSYEWCKRRLAGMATGESNMAKSYPSMSQQRAFLDFKQSGKNSQQWITMLATGDSLQCNLIANGNWAGGSYAGLAAPVDQLPAGVFILIATGATTAHAMTLSFGKTGTLFFDPNTGQYSVSAGKIGSDVEAHLTTYYSGVDPFSPGYWRVFQLAGNPTHLPSV